MPLDGLTVKDIIIGDEDPHEFEALRAELELNFQPRTRFDMPGLDAALARARQEEVDNLLQSEMQAEADRACTCRLNEETRLRCEESFGNDDDSIYAATLNGTYASRFKTFLEEVKAEENKPDCDGSIPAQEMVHSNRGTGLLMLIQDSVDKTPHIRRYCARSEVGKLQIPRGIAGSTTAGLASVRPSCELR